MEGVEQERTTSLCYPAHPEVTYRDDGWVSGPDWLGNGKERGAWRSFTEGRAYARGLELKSQKEWHAWRKSGQRPSDTPVDPSQVYRNVGWISYPDWLGSGKERVSWKSFTEGRAYVRGLELKGQLGWREWSKSGQRPSDIPTNPEKTYRDNGWTSCGPTGLAMIESRGRASRRGGRSCGVWS